MRFASVVAVVALALLQGAVAPDPPAPFNSQCIVGMKNLYDPSKLSALPEYTVDLDLPPEQRWQKITAMYKVKIQALLKVIKDFTFPLAHGKIFQWIDKHMGDWDSRLRQPYRDELKGIANATGMPLGEIVLYNLFYEIHSACTSIVAKAPDGKLYHGRNMDFGFGLGWNTQTHRWVLTERMRDVNINVKFMKGGKLLATEVTYAGFVGTFNGMRKDGFTVTMNTRFDFAHGGLIKIAEWLLGLTGSDVRFTTWLAREALETAPDFHSAKVMLMTTPIMGPAYYIMAGVKPDEGAIVARSPNRLVDLVELNDGSKDSDWFILQTNYDPKKKPLYLDDRRTPGHACMNQLGQKNVSFAGLFNVLSSKTNLNKQTAFTVLMQVNDGRFETYHQHCEDPCWFA